MLALKKLQTQKPASDLLEIENQVISEEKLDEYSADWVKRDMDEAAWRALSEKERQNLIMEAKLAQRKLQKELYGDDWIKHLKALEGDEEAIKKLQVERREEFNTRLAAMLALKKLQAQKPASDLLEIEDQTISEEEEEQYCAEWVKREMDEEAWRRLSTQERHRLIMQAKLAEKLLRQEMYGEDWRKKMEELHGDEAALAELRLKQKAVFAAKLKERMEGHLNRNILVLIVEEKYKVISTLTNDTKYDSIKETELEIIKTLPEDDPIIQFSALSNLYEICCCGNVENVDDVDYMMKNLTKMTSDKFNAIISKFAANVPVKTADELKERVSSYADKSAWSVVSSLTAVTQDFIQTKFDAMNEAMKIWDDSKIRNAAVDFSNYTSTWLKCRKFQIYLQLIANNQLEERASKRLVREVIAIIAADKIQNGSSLSNTDLKQSVILQFLQLVHNGDMTEIQTISCRPMYALISSLLKDYSNFNENQSAQKLYTQIKSKYDCLRQKALRLISKGDPNNPRPKPEAKQFYENLKIEVEKTKTDRRQLGKIMKKHGFITPFKEPPEDSFGPNLGRFYFYCNEANTSMVMVTEDTIQPPSDLIDNEELYYVLHQYEEMEMATLYLNTMNIDAEILWQKSEKEKVDRIDNFIDALTLSQLSARTHISAQYSSAKLHKDGERYIRVARSVLTQTDFQKTFKVPQEPKENDFNLWRYFSDQVLQLSQKNCHELLVSILNDPFSDELRDFAVAMNESSRAAKITELNEKRKKIDFSNPNGKLDHRSMIEEALAIVFANRMSVAEKITTEEVTALDVNASILGELLEEFNVIREGYWYTETDKVISQAKNNAQQLQYEFENGTSEDIWNLIIGNIATAEKTIISDLNELANQHQDKLIAEQLIQHMGTTDWNKLSEQERQKKIFQLRRLNAINNRDALGSSAKKVLSDFNGNETAYAQYLEEQKSKYRMALDEKIAKMKATKAKTDEEEAHIKDEINNIIVLKRSLSDLGKLELHVEKEKLILLQDLHDQSDKLSAERKRQMLNLQMKVS